MPNFAANLTMMFNEVGFLDRFQAASDAGFTGVEYLFPYEFDKEDLADKLLENGLTQVLHNMPAGNWDEGDRGIACLPERIGEFQDGVGDSIEYATALGCKRVNCLSGIEPDDEDPEKLEDTLVNNLRFAVQKLSESGIGLLIEPINTRDIPGFHLRHTYQARSIIEHVGSDNLRLQYDIYHMQIMEGDLTPTLKENIDIIGHIQIADNPGRNEPGTGEINYPYLFRTIDAIGYAGWVGCEYKPLNATYDGLGWVAEYINP